jgi:hypothetical protein
LGWLNCWSVVPFFSILPSLLRFWTDKFYCVFGPVLQKDFEIYLNCWPSKFSLQIKTHLLIALYYK